MSPLFLSPLFSDVVRLKTMLMNKTALALVSLMAISSLLIRPTTAGDATGIVIENGDANLPKDFDDEEIPSLRGLSDGHGHQHGGHHHKSHRHHHHSHDHKHQHDGYGHDDNNGDDGSGN